MKVVAVDQKLICVIVAWIAQDGDTLVCKVPCRVDCLRRRDEIGSIRQLPRYGHTATLLRDGKFYIGGGGISPPSDNYETDLVDRDELFDPATETFQPTGKLHRAWHTATRLQNGDVLFTGGMSADNTTQLILSAGDELLKAGSGTLQPTGNMSIARYSHTATLLQDGKLLITGGYDSSPKILPTAEIYDPVSGTFTRVGDMGKPRSGHFATLLTTGKVLITGGGIAGSGVADAELFDPATSAFTSAGKTSSSTVGAATLLSDGRVLISGEANSDFSGPAPGEIYDPANGKFTPTGTMATLRFGYSATLLPDGTVLIAGGEMVDGSRRPVVADSEIYNPATGAFTLGPMMSQSMACGSEATRV